jgi:hypothetical protein
MNSGTQPFTNVPPDDADHLLYMVEQAHQPFRSPPIHIGEIADEWVTRWRRAQPKAERNVGVSLNRAVVGMMGDAHRMQFRAPDSQVQVTGFSSEEAAAIIAKRWPGIVLGEPQRAWSRQPVIAELQQLRYAVRQSDPNQAPNDSARYRHSAMELVR